MPLSAARCLTPKCPPGISSYAPSFDSRATSARKLQALEEALAENPGHHALIICFDEPLQSVSDNAKIQVVSSVRFLSAPTQHL